MRVFKPTRKGPRGASIPYGRWYVELRDHRGIVRRLAAFTDKGASEELGRKLERLAELRAVGETPSGDLARFLEDLPREVRGKLGRWGLLDARRLAGSLPLVEHLAEFEQTLRARERSAAHVGVTVQRVRDLLAGAGAMMPSELRAEAVERYLRSRRAEGLSARSSNGYLQAARQFCGWMVSTGRALEDPLRVLRPVNERTDRRLERRAFTPAELRSLLRAAEAGPERFGIPGAERALLYRTAAETGLRANELRSLRAGDLEDLGGERPAVRLRAEHSKRKREDRLPLRPDLAARLAQAVRDKLPGAPVFDVPSKSAAMLRADLEAAGIPWEDGSGRVLDFHALRVSFVSNLARAGVAPKVAQALARHSTPNLTFNVYAKLGANDEREALASLPDLDEPGGEALRRTGTDGAPGNVASCVAFAGAPRSSPLQPDAASRTLEGPAGVAKWQTRWIQNPLPARV